MGSPKRTSEFYHELAHKKHNHVYDYSNWSGYNPIHTKVCIICHTHGNFYQTIANHVNGAGCPFCRNEELLSGFNKKPLSYFINKAKQIHNDFYDYSKWVDVKNTSIDTVVIICPIHGEFNQTPASHIDKKAGCSICANDNRKQTCTKKYGVDHPSKQHMSELVLSRLQEVDWLTYQHHTSHRTLDNISHELKIQDTTVGKYFKKYDIPVKQFFSSIGECDISLFLTNNDIQIEVNNRTIISPKEIDIYIPSHNIAIEFCGLYWHSDIHKTNYYHKTKLELCKQRGIRLITIFEDEWKYKQTIVQNKLLTILGKSNQSTIFARKCNVVEVNTKNKTKFFDQYHIQGSGPGSISYGLQYNNKLVACMSFIKQKDGIYVLNRYATSNNIPGGFSKLLSHFKKNCEWNQVVSFADLRWSEGDVYENNGFILDKKLLPDYSYIVNNKRFHKFGFRRKFLEKKLPNFDPLLSERQNCDNAGLLRIWDCGKLRYIINNS